MPPTGKLYIVATPIGNLGDITYRAIETLKQCDLVAAEDTRHTKRLLDRYGIAASLVSLHEHNEIKVIADLLKRLQRGESIAVVSDAGTPLVNDPGYQLVRTVVDSGGAVVSIPGPCALIAGLSVSGLATDRFTFLGFPPRTTTMRKSWFESLLGLSGTLIFYESCHRILACLKDLSEVFPAEREVAVARELTKIHEAVIKTTISELLFLIDEDPNLNRGELIVLVQGATNDDNNGHQLEAEHIQLLKTLLQECSVKTSATLAARITGLSRKILYSAALELK